MSYLIEPLEYRRYLIDELEKNSFISSQLISAILYVYETIGKSLLISCEGVDYLFLNDSSPDILTVCKEISEVGKLSPAYTKPSIELKTEPELEEFLLSLELVLLQQIAANLIVFIGYPTEEGYVETVHVESGVEIIPEIKSYMFFENCLANALAQLLKLILTLKRQ